VLPWTDVLRETLGASPGETWVIRPDAHVAAILAPSDALDPALGRVTGRN
jgi:3-(3-hydroxy-phenyl)propionate hydroxylase